MTTLSHFFIEDDFHPPETAKTPSQHDGHPGHPNPLAAVGFATLGDGHRETRSDGKVQTVKPKPPRGQMVFFMINHLEVAGPPFPQTPMSFSPGPQGLCQVVPSRLHGTSMEVP